MKARGVPTTTNDTWSELRDHPKVVAKCDVVMADFYPYWEGVAIGEAVKSLHADYLTLKAVAGPRRSSSARRARPSAGNTVGRCCPSDANAAFPC